FLTVPVLVLIGGWAAYVEFDHALGPREAPVANLGTILSDLAIPAALFKEAQKDEPSQVFDDFTSYRSFLEKEGLDHSVLIARTRSTNGVLLYDAFPLLDDPNTFAQYIAGLPALTSGRQQGLAPAEHTLVHAMPASKLSSR